MIYKFGDFTFDTQLRKLKQKDHMLALTPKVYSLLLLLIEAKGKVVSKEEIYQHVWFNRVVSETTLYKVIERLRTLMGEDGENSHFIKNIHGEGYQFSHPVLLKPLHRKKYTMKKMFLGFSSIFF